MSTVTENDLKELKDLLNGRFDRLENKIQDMEIKLGKIEEKTAGLDKRLDDLNSRFNIMTIGFLSIIGVLVTGVLTVIAKLVFFPASLNP
jgi:predicted nuclease with TOPRIM domain